MQHNIKSLIGFKIGATDGEIGKVSEFYFDDETWTIRYLVVETGSWLLERKVLISPGALTKPDWENELFPVSLTKDQVKDSPDIDTQMPVSRQQELSLYDHYGWPYAAAAGTDFYGGMGMMGMSESRLPFDQAIAVQQHEKEPGDPHLRSTAEVKGYKIHATDGEIGDVSDFIIGGDWKIRFLIVDTGSWFPGKKVFISPKWITKVSWEESSVYVNVPVVAVKNSPEYNQDRPIPENYESDLNRHYGK